jgi:hypothetical protein
VAKEEKSALWPELNEWGARSPFVWLCHDESIEWGRVFRRAESFKLYK